MVAHEMQSSSELLRQVRRLCHQLIITAEVSVRPHVRPSIGCPHLNTDQQFLNLLFWSGIFDLFGLLLVSRGFFSTILAFIVLLIKFPIGVTCSNVLRERGGQFNVGGWLPGRAGQGSKSFPASLAWSLACHRLHECVEIMTAAKVLA